MALEALNSPTAAPPLLKQDDVDLLEPWGKKKRTKRPRMVNPEEEYLAICLLMLAQGNTKKSTIKNTLPQPPPPPTLDINYKCSVCDRSFPSYQALGGHRASHRKLLAEADELAAAAAVSSDSAPIYPGGRSHTCSICYKTFPSGQALGGHKRCHYLVQSQREFDLNLPALPEPFFRC